MGRLNDVSQMCSFMKVFRQPINKCISDIPSDAPPECDVVVDVIKYRCRYLSTYSFFVFIVLWYLESTTCTATSLSLFVQFLIRYVIPCPVLLG